MDQGYLVNKLASWCTLYAVAIVFIGLRIYSRLYIFGSLTIEDWLMIAAGMAYTATMVLEILLWDAYRVVNILSFLKVSSHSNLAD